MSVDKMDIDDPEIKTVTLHSHVAASNLRADPEDILTGRAAEGASVSWRTPFNPEWDDDMPEATKIGLENNTSQNLCYRNVTFQMLVHAPVILHWVEWYRNHHVPKGKICRLGNGAKRCKVCLFHDFLITYWDGARGDCKTAFDALWEDVFGDWFEGSNTGQQDPAEFFPEFCRQLLEDIKPLFRSDLQHVWGIPTVTVTECRGPYACSRATYRQSESDYLNARFPTGKGTVIIGDAVDEFFAASAIEGGDCPACQNPRFNSDRIGHPPELLLVRLNRIEWSDGPEGPKASKIHRDIDFSESLTLKADQFDPRLGDQRQDVEYELSSVTVHQGDSPQSGHYYLVVKGPSGYWTSASDLNLKSHDTETILGGDLLKRRGYIFSYRRKPTKLHDLEKAEGQREEGKDGEGMTQRPRDSTVSGDIAIAQTSERMEQIDLESARGTLEFKFTPNEGEAQSVHLSIRGMIKNLIKGKGLKKKEKKEVAPAVEGEKHETRGSTKRRAEDDAEKPEEPKRPKRAPYRRGGSRV